MRGELAGVCAQERNVYKKNEDVRGREGGMMDRLRVKRIFSVSHRGSNSSLERAWKFYLQLGNLDQERHRASCLIRTNPLSDSAT